MRSASLEARAIVLKLMTRVNGLKLDDAKTCMVTCLEDIISITELSRKQLSFTREVISEIEKL